MATRRSNPAPPADVDEGAEEWRNVVPLAAPAAEDVERDPGERIAMLIRDSGSDAEASIRVYKRIPNSVKYSWCVNYTAAEFQGGDLGMIRDQWGPGEYSLRVYGRNGLLAREDVTIAQQMNIAVQAQPAAPAQPSADQFTRALETIAQGQAAILQALSSRPDPTQQMQQTLTLLTQMREAMGLNQNPAAPAAVSPTAVLKDVIDAVRSMREISDEINPKPVDPDNPLTLAGPLLEIVKTAITQRSGGAGPDVTPLALPPSIQNAPAAPQAVQAQPSGTEQMGIMLLRGALQGLLQLKEKGEPATVGGRYIAEKLPDELLPYLDLPNWFEIARNFAPELGPHEAWVREATAEAIRILSSDDPPESGA